MLFDDGFVSKIFRYMLVFAIILVFFFWDTFTHLGLAGHLEFAKNRGESLQRVSPVHFSFLFSIMHTYIVFHITFNHILRLFFLCLLHFILIDCTLKSDLRIKRYDRLKYACQWHFSYSIFLPPSMLCVHLWTPIPDDPTIGSGSFRSHWRNGTFVFVTKLNFA